MEVIPDGDNCIHDSAKHKIGTATIIAIVKNPNIFNLVKHIFCNNNVEGSLDPLILSALGRQIPVHSPLKRLLHNKNIFYCNL